MNCPLSQANGPYTLMMVKIIYISNYVYTKMLATLCLVPNLFWKLHGLNINV